VQSSGQIVTTNKPAPNFLQAGCPSCCPTNSIKAPKGKLQGLLVKTYFYTLNIRHASSHQTNIDKTLNKE